MGFSRVSFLYRMVDLLANDSFSVILLPCLCRVWADRETANSLSWSVALPALLLGARHIRGHTPSFLRLPSFHSSFGLEASSLVRGF